MTKNTSPAIIPADKPMTAKSLFSQDNIKKRFEDMLGKKAQGFITSVLQIVASNELLKEADPMSVYNSAAVAATLDLPLNNNLGMAYIVPYKTRQPDGTYKVVAQFQMGYKGFIQLGQRSNQYKTMNSTDVREGEIKNHDRLSGEITFEWIQGPDRIQKPVIGYVSYFKLLNGFEKPFYMTYEEVKAHGTEYSQAYKKGFGLWKDKFDAMANKTVLKLLISKYGPLSIAMQTAILADQAIINDPNPETLNVTYIDNPNTDLPPIDKEAERITLMIKDAATPEELEKLRPHIETDAQIELFADRREELSKPKNKK